MKELEDVDGRHKESEDVWSESSSHARLKPTCAA